jgi:hypothetical protein
MRFRGALRFNSLPRQQKEVRPSEGLLFAYGGSFERRKRRIGKGGPVTRIIEHRQDAGPGEELLELRVFQFRYGDVRACVVSADLAVDLDMLTDMSEPVAQAYLNALALCEAESVATLWVHDPLGLFPPRHRPEVEL